MELKFAAIRAGPQPLTHRQLLGLSRAIHELYVEAFQDDPGSKNIWVPGSDSLADGLVGRGKKSVADVYRHYSIKMQAAVVRRVPVSVLTSAAVQLEIASGSQALGRPLMR